jgi:integrase
MVQMGMQKVPNHERLYKRGNTYQYRSLIPVELRAYFGGKAEIKKSLKTDSLKEAKVRWAIECEKTDREIADARHKLETSRNSRRTPTRSEAWAMVRDWHTEQLEREKLALASASIEDLPARLQHSREEQTVHAQHGFVQKFHPMADAVLGFLCERSDLQTPAPGSEVYCYMADLIHRARADVLRRSIALMENDTNEHPAGIDQIFLERPGELQDPQPAATMLNPGSKHVAVPLGNAVEAYVNDPTRNAKDSTRRANRDKLSPLVRHFGADADLKDITSEDFEAWTRLLLRLPKNAGKRFPAGSLEEMVKAGEAVGAEPIARSNARGIQQSASSLIDHLVKRERLDRNRLKPHILPKTKFTKPTRRPFTVAELNTLFRQPVFTGCIDEERGFAKTGPNVPKRSRYWLPLIALFTGMRMGEIAQLWTDDVLEQDGVWALRVQFNADRDQELKNPGSDRIIPIHKTLIDLGFVDWASAARQKNASRLFPDIPKSKDKQDFSSIFSKRFSKFLETADLWRDGRTFHSLRHNFRDAVRDADLSDGVAKVLGGWADDEPHNQYGRGYKIEMLKAAIDKLDFVDGDERLDLKHLVQKQ